MNIIIAEFLEKLKIRSLASNATKCWSIYFSFFMTPFDVNVLSSLICAIYIWLMHALKLLKFIQFFKPPFEKSKWNTIIILWQKIILYLLNVISFCPPPKHWVIVHAWVVIIKIRSLSCAQTWKKMKSFRGHRLRVSHISANRELNISKLMHNLWLKMTS